MELVQGILEVGKVIVVKSRSLYVFMYKNKKVMVKKLKKAKAKKHLPRNPVSCHGKPAKLHSV